jgi:hypothetical protein
VKLYNAHNSIDAVAGQLQLCKEITYAYNTIAQTVREAFCATVPKVHGCAALDLRTDTVGDPLMWSGNAIIQAVPRDVQQL